MAYPDYSRSLVNLMSRIAMNYGVRHAYPAVQLPVLDNLADARNVILLVIDGMGYHYVTEHAGLFQKHQHAHLTSVFPSTTASSISTFLTGQAPQQHGLTGWFVYFKEIDEVTAVLPFHVRGSNELLSERGIDIRELYQHIPFFDLLQVDSYVVSPDWIIDSPFNRSHCGKATSEPYSDLESMCTCINQLASQQDRKYIYAYWPEFDRLSHKFGNRSDQVAEHYETLERAIETLCDQLQGTATKLLVTADHGFIDTTPDRMINVNQHPRMQECLRLPLCGEPRLAYCYVHQNKMAQFEDYVTETFSHQLECHQSKTMVAQGVFGNGEAHPQLYDRVGDYMLVMKDNYVIKDWLPVEKPFFHIGVHGGTSEREMHVPLIVMDL
jgi:arylsulfatase A-like enzyme